MRKEQQDVRIRDRHDLRVKENEDSR